MIPRQSNNQSAYVQRPRIWPLVCVAILCCYVQFIETTRDATEPGGKRQLGDDVMQAGQLLLVRKHHHLQHHVNRKQLVDNTNSVQDDSGDGNVDADAGGQLTIDGQHSGATKGQLGQSIRGLIRIKRAKPRIQLAQRPPKSTTTSTTSAPTTTPTATTSTEILQSSVGQSGGGDNEADPSVSDDYEEVHGSARVVPNERQASKMVVVEPTEEVEEEEEGEAEAEAEEEEAGGSSDATATTTTTTTTTTSTSTTTTTTTLPSTTRRTGRLRAKGDRSRSGAKTAEKGAGSSTRSSLPSSSSSSSKSNAPSEISGDKSKSDGTVAVRAEDELSSATAAMEQTAPAMHHGKKKPLLKLPFIRPKNASVCTSEAYLEFPRDLIGNKWRARGLVLIHIVVVCYMFYSLALVCEKYFMPSLEEFALRLNLSEDVAGATLMSAGSSAPELFTAILGVFVAKGDVGTGTIVGSAVFNILFVIGVCAFVSTTSAQLHWWPVLRDSVYYAFTVLVLIICIYDERVTGLESFTMIALYGVYILIMVHNDTMKEFVTRLLLMNPYTAKLLSSVTSSSADGPDDVFGSVTIGGGLIQTSKGGQRDGGGGQLSNCLTSSSINSAKVTNVEEDSLFLAAQLIIVKHKRLFRSQLRFQSAARYIIIKRQHRIQSQQNKLATIKQSDEVNYFGPESEPLKGSGSSGQRARMEAYAQSSSVSKQKFSIVSKDDYEFWNRPPEEGENYYLWLAKIPVNFVLHYTVPNCSLYPEKYLITFLVSILWTALFSYIMVWMVTLIGFTLGIPDSVMGATFLAAGTSVPDCYSSVHAARNGMADMAVSNSIGSNVFDILIGLSLPWFIQTTIYPQVVATINSRGVIYSVILLFLSLIITIYLLNKYNWTLKPRLGLALLIAYGLFIILTCMLEFNLFGNVNPPPCPVV